ncbi:MAG: hypothetical protein PHV60_10270 [bacterium]|nr:hypothetical protein [bacterium]
MAVIQEFINIILPFFDSVPAIRGVIGFLVVFVAPGFAWTLVIFDFKRINMLERMVLSTGISIASVTLCILSLNLLFNVRITGINSMLAILVLTALPLVWYFIKRLAFKPVNVADNNDI